MIGYIGNYFSNHGHSPQICEILSDALEARGVSVERVSHFKSPLPKLIHLLIRIIFYGKKNTPYIIDTFSGKAFVWAYWSSLLCRFKKQPYIAYLHGGNLPAFSKKYQIPVNQYLRNAKIINCPSPYLKNWVNNLGYQSELIPNPLRSVFFQHQIHWTPNPKKILWVRRFHSLYNPQLAILVLHHILQQNPTYCMTMAGPDSGELAECKKLAFNLNINNSILFLPIQNPTQLIEHAKISSCFLNTSHVDNTPSTLLEMSALGLPIVSTNVGGIPHLFTNKKNSLLGTENAGKLAELILSLHQYPTHTNQIILEAKKLTADLSLESVVEKWESILKRITP